ncbi:hypothetical protein [Streptomyces sp. NPDC058206]|uniref:hypothetical protein n=1 Tax=Streptomyces sp. NPDC058206 TaxID=3346382 RepID=UPI0036ED32AC
MTTPNDMPTNVHPAFAANENNRELPSRVRGGSTRALADRLTRQMVHQIYTDGLMPDGKPHPLLDHLPEMLRSAAAYGTYTLEVRRAQREKLIPIGDSTAHEETGTSE